jgi:hypothetical protein
VPGRDAIDDDLLLVELVIIDGDNLLHAVRGSRDAGGVAWLLPRLRAWRPPTVTVIVTLDGPPDRGLGDRRPIAPGISVRHSGTHSADDVIVSTVEARPYADRARTVVVTDDGRLRERVRRAGGIGRRVSWLTERLTGALVDVPNGARSPSSGRPPSGSTIGSGRRPATGPDPARPPADGDAERPSWRPGRGATRKSGNPKRDRRLRRRP